MTPRTWRHFVKGWNRHIKAMNKPDGKNIMPEKEARALAEHFRKIDQDKAK